MAPVTSIREMQTAQSQQPLDARQKLRLQNAVKEFEAVLGGYMLKSMRSSIPKDDMFGESYGGDMLEGMFDVELARHVSRSSSLGLGEMLYKEITGEEMPRVQPASSGAIPNTVRRAAAASAHHALSRPSPLALRAEAATDSMPTTRAVTASTSQAVPPAPAAGSAAVSGPQETAVPDTVRQRLDALLPIIRDASERHGVDAHLLSAVIATESAGRSTAQSPKKAKGLMQLIDSTAHDMGVRNVWDPRQNVNGGAKYLSQLLERFEGNVEQALASYNAGPGAVEKHQGVPPYRETQEYVDRVLQYLRFFEQQEPGVNDKD